jgi:3'-phosphoadenosine 5'-phosphosulfate sulfotransferase (PAPS reductase)/FAD synthetase
MMASKHIIAFGGGVDSSALLAINLHRDRAAQILGISRAELDARFAPVDAVMFSDTGWERDATYANVDRFQAEYAPRWIPFYRVRRKGENIFEWSMRLGALPLMPGSHHICSLKFKMEVMHKEAVKRFPGHTFIWSVGIEANEDRRANKSFQDKNDSVHTSVHPLRALGMDRLACFHMLNKLGYGLVTKSSCVGCPFMQPEEMLELIKTEPEAWASVKALEARVKETSAIKHQRFLDNGSVLVGTRRPHARAGEWRRDSHKDGARLFARKHEGRQLSVEEWEALLTATVN